MLLANGKSVMSQRLQLVVTTFILSYLLNFWKQLLEFCDLLIFHLIYTWLLIFLEYSCTMCNLQLGGLAFYRPRPTRQTSSFDHVILFLSSTEALTCTGQIRLVFQTLHATLSLLPLLMRCLNKTGNILRNRYSVSRRDHLTWGNLDCKLFKLRMEKRNIDLIFCDGKLWT